MYVTCLSPLPQSDLIIPSGVRPGLDVADCFLQGLDIPEEGALIGIVGFEGFSQSSLRFAAHAGFHMQRMGQNIVRLGQKIVGMINSLAG